jgi:hypothetical protein
MSRRFSPIPKFDDLDILEEWKVTIETDQRTPLKHYRELETQIIILSTDNRIRRLANDRWQIDRNFESAT